MKENEIRIGNWFIHNGNWSHRNDYEELKNSFYFQWENNDWYALGECTFSFDDFEPIPLTTEILEKVGFVNDELIINGNDNSVISRNKDNTFSLWVEGYYGFGKCKYLHQIQNLVYSLTGRELNITL